MCIRDRLHGEYVNHNVYGSQFKVVLHKVKEPEDKVSIERYLGSGAVKGVGAALAGRIVAKFREDTFRIIEQEPERLAEVKGISERKAQEIAEQIAAKKDMRQAMIYLQKYGISVNLAAKIFKEYGHELYSIIEENPYRLADDIAGVGFKIADEIAVKAGIRADSAYRIKSGILYTLLQAISNGHTYLPLEELTRLTGQLLGVELESVEPLISDLIMERRLVVKKEEEQLSLIHIWIPVIEALTGHFFKNGKSVIADDDISDCPNILFDARQADTIPGSQRPVDFLTDVGQTPGIFDCHFHGRDKVRVSRIALEYTNAEQEFG